MEYKVRYFYNKSEYEKIIDRLKEIPQIHSNLKTYEYVTHYNHCNKEYDFYDEKVDGIFGLKISRNELSSKSKLSWSQKIKNDEGIVTNTLKKEVRFNSEDLDEFMYIIENIMHFKKIESYERYRVIFENNDVEVDVDEYPFGICIKIESKSINEKSEESLKYWTNIIGLDYEKGYKRYWSYKYQELCEEQKISCSNEVVFGKNMPQIKNKFIINK